MSGSIRDRALAYINGRKGATTREIADAIDQPSRQVSSVLVRAQKAGLVDKAGDSWHSVHTANVPSLPVRQRRDLAVPHWTPGIDYDRDGGELRTAPRTLPEATGPADSEQPEDAELFQQFGLDPAKWTITNLRKSTWQSVTAEGTQWLEAYRASFVPRTQSPAEAAALTEEDVEKFLVDYNAFTTEPDTVAPETWMVPVGDLQLGKPDGDGTAGIIERFARCTESVRQSLEAAGGVDRLVLPWLGDCIEGIVSQGGRNVARLDRTITEQVRILRRLTLHQIGTLAPYANRVLVIALPGNHDEAYRMQTMSPADSWAVDAASAVADALALHDEYAHVDFHFPEEEEMGVTVDLGGYTVHFTHGHVARNPNKMLDWWKNQAHGRQQAGAADLLVTAHFHHFRVEHTGGGKTWLQIPALDGGSDYFRRRTGEEAPAGMVSLRVGADIPGGWSDLTIHG